MISTRFSVATLAAALMLGACGDDPEETETETSVNESTASETAVDDSTVELMQETEESAAPEHSVSVTVPDDWYEADPQDGFHYQYLWEGNDWDDIVAQDFDTHDYEFEGDYFVDLLEDSLSENSTIEVREENTQFGSYPAIIIDVVYDSGTYTSLTYVNVEGRLWEFTVNSQTPEGLARGEEINETAEFSIN